MLRGDQEGSHELRKKYDELLETVMMLKSEKTNLMEEYSINTEQLENALREKEKMFEESQLLFNDLRDKYEELRKENKHWKDKYQKKKEKYKD